MLSIPGILFFILLFVGVWLNELTWMNALAFLGIWLAMIVLFGIFNLSGLMLVIIYVMFDIVLLFKIFGSDVKNL